MYFDRLFGLALLLFLVTLFFLYSWWWWWFFFSLFMRLLLLQVGMRKRERAKNYSRPELKTFEQLFWSCIGNKWPVCRKWLGISESGHREGRPVNAFTAETGNGLCSCFSLWPGLAWLTFYWGTSGWGERAKNKWHQARSQLLKSASSATLDFVVFFLLLSLLLFLFFFSFFTLPIGICNHHDDDCYCCE